MDKEIWIQRCNDRFKGGIMSDTMRGLAHTTDPKTSHEAAALVDMHGMAETIYRHMLKYHAGCIMDDILDDMPSVSIVSISPVFARMAERGMIVATGETRKGYRSGRQQIVRKALPKPWFAVPQKKTTTAKQLLAELAFALDNAFIIPQQSTRSWHSQLGAALKYLSENEE